MQVQKIKKRQDPWAGFKRNDPEKAEKTDNKRCNIHTCSSHADPKDKPDSHLS